MKQVELVVQIHQGIFLDVALPRGEVKIRHRDFVVVMSNDRGSVLLDIMDANSGDHLQRFLWQFAPVPRDMFAGDGFTGLVYINHPKTGSELQLICSTEPLKSR